ncbi:MAG TPA: hypothetical protein VGG01_22505 [Xanthobacteraceae bacterium]|jgi:hypothetical protein
MSLQLVSLRPLLARAAAALAAAALLAGPARAADPVYPLASHIGLAAPGAMKPSPAFRGFVDPAAGASILIVEVPSAAAAKIEGEMTPEAIKRQGLIEEKREDVTLKTGKGLLIVGEQTAAAKTVRRWIMLTSGADIGALIAVQVPDDAKAKYSDADVRAALLSMVVRPTVPVEELLDLLPVKFDNLAGLRPFRVLGNSSVFMTDGAQDTLEAVTQPIFIVSIASGGPEDQANRATFARNLFTGLSEFKDVRIVSTDMLRLDNKPTHEIQAEAKDAKTGTPMKLVQWVRFANRAFIRYVGAARADVWLQAFPKFRAVRDGVEPKS